MNYQLTGLNPDSFRPAFSLTDAELQAQGIRRVIVDRENGYPCRISLEDAEVGEEVLLLPYVHQATNSPYRASGPIYVRRKAEVRASVANRVPAMLARRLLSVRAYSHRDEIIDAQVCPGEAVEPLIERFLVDPQVAYLHVHFARYGCFACRVDR
jgi:Protein of unknown function (DUF1203)